MIEAIHRLGAITFAQFMEMALYGPGVGFFATGGGAGRRGDFITSPELGPVFGMVIARALDTWWAEQDRPDPFVVVEAGAGAGTLGAAVRAAAPECSGALQYVMVERSQPLRGRQAAAIPLEPPSGGFSASDEDHGAETTARRPNPAGPTFTSLEEMPAGPFTGVVIANELLDNLPFHLLERGEGWQEVRVGEVDGRLVEVPVPASPALSADADSLVPAVHAGGRIPLQYQAGTWLSEALSRLERGRVVVIDYADTTPSLALRSPLEWLRTYRSHGRGGDLLDHAGAQDITCEVATDQLARVRQPSIDRTQADFLRAHGIEDMTTAARALWHERAHVGDLEAIKARSLVGEAAALTDPTGLGGFRVLEWCLD